jgi:DNA polymerase elongation subunit (family B)
MPKLVFDIETVGEDYNKLDETTQGFLTRWIRKESDSEEAYKKELEVLKNEMGYSPFTGEVVVIGVLDVEKNKGMVYFQAPGKEIDDFEENGIKFKQTTEREMLEKFWDGVLDYNEFISFNGRGFDVPFTMIRSAIHKIRPTKDLMSNRYLYSQKFDAKHVDLADQLTFYGSRKKESLHLCTRAFGIKSPKADGINGNDVARLFKEGKYEDIAKYNRNDLIATKELYAYWDKYLRF